MDKQNRNPKYDIWNYLKRLESRITELNTTLSNQVPTGTIVDYNCRTAPTGWVMATEGETIGDSVSNADYNSSDCFNLFRLIWENILSDSNYSSSDNAYTLLEADGSSASVGSTYLTDWNSHKKIKIDLRGCFIRADNGWESGALVDDPDRDTDAEKVLGYLQGDAFQGHWHYGIGITTGSGWPNTNAYLRTAKDTGRYSADDPAPDGVNGTPRTSSETRPSNIILPKIMKL